MGVKKYKPTSPGRRHMMVDTFSDITAKKPEKSLLRKLTKKAGRNSYGHITVRHRGGGHKRRFRVIDFKRDKDGIPGKVATIEYDPNRTARIALIHYVDGEKRYILAPVGLEVGAMILSGETADILPGNTLPLKDIPSGTIVHAIEMKPGKGAQIVRSAGAGSQILSKEGGYALMRLPSGEVRRIPALCKATIGQVGNVDHQNIHIGKAGRVRWLGRRPRVRGVVKNPVDHPMGGGEGKSSGGRHPVSPTGIPAKGFKTRKVRKESDKYIVRRRSKK